MSSGNYEIEIKFKIEDFEKVSNRLEQIGAKRMGKAFQRTLRFDTKDGKLANSGRFLRLRTGFKTTITFKSKIPSEKFREREEIELEISDPEKMRVILERLGFDWVRIMEKNREEWKLDGVEIVVDELPFGNYIEIEGTKEAIEDTMRKLGLDSEKRLTQTYWDLHQEYCREKRVKEENIIFPKN